MLYSEKVLEHFTNPHNVGEIEDAKTVTAVLKAKVQFNLSSGGSL